MVDADPIELPGFRVEELSARTGAPVRTIREYQTWQILHPPTKVGRVGLYDESHVRRLERIARLQERGYSIAAIRDLFRAWEQGAGLRDVLGVDDDIDVPSDEVAIVLTPAQLHELVPAIAGSTRRLARARRIGLVTPHHDGYVARSPALLQLVADAVAVGLSPTDALDIAEAVIAGADRVGEVVATAVADGVRDDLDRVEGLLRRGRVLLTRAVATHTIDQVGRHLLDRSASDPDVGALLATVRIGAEPSRPGIGGTGSTQEDGAATSTRRTRSRRKPQS